MRTIYATITGLLLLCFLLSMNAYAQQAGDYRSMADGDWSNAATWETFDGASWINAATAPDGSETITIAGDSVNVSVAVTITGVVQLGDEGVLSVEGGSLTFANGSSYVHARDAGTVPSATWEEGSTALFTGITSDAPDNRGQDYYNMTLNTPGLLSNEDLSLDGHTIGGDITVISSGDARWRLVGGSSGEITIMGDVIVQGDASLETLGTSSPTDVVVNHFGDIMVTGGAFSVSRGSQGSGTGTVTWNLFGGDFTMVDAETRNSNPTPGNAKFVFAGAGTQQLSFTNVEYGGGNIHFAVSDSTTLEIADGFALNGLLVNHGEVVPLGEFTVLDGGVYEHARDGGTVPSATWEEGSTALFTGITSEAPENRGQDYYNLTLDTPELASNADLSLDGHSIGGDITVLSSGGSRWRLVGGSSGTVDILGDVIVRNASFETQGTGSATDVVVNHYGNVDIDGGEFSVSRGSQGSGTGTTTWYIYEGNFSMMNARTRNSNPTPGNAKFVFAQGGVQELNLGENNQIDDLSIEVADSTTLDVGTSEIGGSGIFTLQDGATLATAHADGVAGSIQTTGEVSLGTDASFTFNGTEAQVTSTMMPTVVTNLTIDNPQGVTLSQETTINGVLRLVSGVFDNTIPFMLGPDGSVSVEGGSLLTTVSSESADEIPTAFALHQNYPNPFNPSTTIRYDLKEQAHVVVKVYDVTGREVAELVNQERGPGQYEVEWNAAGMSSGVYFYQVRTGSWSATRSLHLMK